MTKRKTYHVTPEGPRDPWVTRPWPQVLSVTLVGDGTAVMTRRLSLIPSRWAD